MDAYIGQIIMFGGLFAPQNWAFCHGQVMAISQYQALFAILGTTYGGNGTTTFMLPDLRGRVPVGAGPGSFYDQFTPGLVTGSNTVTMTTNQMPAHTHPVVSSTTASTLAGTLQTPTTGSILAQSNQRNAQFIEAGNAGQTVQLGGGPTIGIAGASQPLSVMQPSIGINFIIALVGIFPSRN
ncbi:phage tail protein [Comamonas koreensis]|uniref:Tail fiber protein n=1 Tax=Comamonas koreensis TaxID=160825 RepID=A0AAW4XSL1_9BURK|nr:tail fiber protein [Comamonas koreensis]MCD2165132.1 tail fiber protein [Comamonas koreensis]